MQRVCYACRPYRIRRRDRSKARHSIQSSSFASEKNFIWRWIDRFFSRVYAFYPFLDQVDFEELVVVIIGPRDKENSRTVSLKITKKMYIVTFSILLLVFWLLYLSVFTNDAAYNYAICKGLDQTQEGKERSFFAQNPIHIDFIISLNNISITLDTFGSATSRFYSFLFIQLYQCYAPENSQVYDITVKGHTSMLINMAMSLGLHREASDEVIASRHPKINHLNRKI